MTIERLIEILAERLAIAEGDYLDYQRYQEDDYANISYGKMTAYADLIELLKQEGLT